MEDDVRERNRGHQGIVWFRCVACEFVLDCAVALRNDSNAVLKDRIAALSISEAGDRQPSAGQPTRTEPREAEQRSASEEVSVGDKRQRA